MPADDRPLSRWSRRKSAARARGGAAPVVVDAPPAVPPVAGEAAPASLGDTTFAAAGPDSEVMPMPSDEAAALDLPDIDTLHAESDFTAFLKEGVPAHLKNLAMRKLWVSDPALANLDGLIDYGEDFTDIKSGVFEAVKTILDSNDGDGNTSGQPEPNPTERETAQADGESPAEPDSDDPAAADREIAAEDAGNERNSADKVEKSEG